MAEYLNLDFTGGDLQGMTFTDGGTNTPVYDNGLELLNGEKAILSSIADLPVNDFQITAVLRPVRAMSSTNVYECYFDLRVPSNAFRTALLLFHISDKLLTRYDFTTAQSLRSDTASSAVSWAADDQLTFKYIKTAAAGLSIVLNDVEVRAIDDAETRADIESAMTVLTLNAEGTSNNQGQMIFESFKLEDYPPVGGGGGSSGPRKRVGLHHRMLKQMLPGRR